MAARRGWAVDAAASRTPARVEARDASLRGSGPRDPERDRPVGRRRAERLGRDRAERQRQVHACCAASTPGTGQAAGPSSIDGAPLDEIAPRERARRIAVLAQEPAPTLRAHRRANWSSRSAACRITRNWSRESGDDRRRRRARRSTRSGAGRLARPAVRPALRRREATRALCPRSCAESRRC